MAAIIVGMAGSGKTTLMQRLNAHLHETKRGGYIMNLDPAVTYMPYGPNIDIRDTVDYKAVMQQYQLGPNGGILTALNLFATRFDQVMKFADQRAKEGMEYLLVDTPGQIEIFTWSASGAIITETLATSFPTVLVYVMDTPRNCRSATFMSNMLYACSMLYKTKLPVVIAFNKTDVLSADFAMEWMRDPEAFQEALAAEKSTYLGSLTQSMSLVLDEFYEGLQAVGVSALTGAGIDDFFAAIDTAAAEFERDYEPEMKAKRAEQEAKEQARQAEELAKMTLDRAAGSDDDEEEEDS